MLLAYRCHLISAKRFYCAGPHSKRDTRIRNDGGAVKNAGKPAKYNGRNIHNGHDRGVFCNQKQGQKMERYAIISRRTKRIVGSAATLDIARAALDAVGSSFVQNFEIVPQPNRTPANER